MDNEKLSKTLQNKDMFIHNRSCQDIFDILMFNVI